MCGRAVQVWDEELERFVWVYMNDIPPSDRGAAAQARGRERKDIIDDLRKLMGDSAYNVAPTHHLGALLMGDDGPQLTAVRWGFPSEAHGLVINARVRTAAKRNSMWGNLLGRSHAAVPVKGFYEWTGPASARVPHFIERADGEPMMLAALWADFDLRKGRGPCIAIVTCDPNPFMARLHDRMPAILEDQSVAAWLDGPALGRESAHDLVAEPASLALKQREVNHDVNDVKNVGPQLLGPPRGGRTTTLF